MDTESSSEEDVDEKFKVTSNPFSVPSIEYSLMETTNPFINLNYEYAALESSYQEPLLALPVTNANTSENANDINPFYVQNIILILIDIFF